MSLNITTRERLTCPRHPRYDPAIGEGGIKAGCACCYLLLKIWRQLEAFTDEVSNFKEIRLGFKK